MTIILWLNNYNAIAQWTKLNSIPTQDIVALELDQNTIYAATLSNIIYKSIDGGSTWTTISVSNNPLVIQTIEFIDNILFVGTVNDGIYQSADNGNSWQNTIGDILPVTDFTKKAQDIYAATLGNGVYIFNPILNTWVPFNHSLPLNVAGSVNKMASTEDYLFIASGANGVFHTYNFSTKQWEDGYYYGSLAPGLEIKDLIHSADTIMVVSGNRVIRTENAGQGWTNDAIGSRNGIDRKIYRGSNDHYLVTNLIQGGSWIQKRNQYASNGVSWANNEEFIPDVYAYDILEYEDKLFLATAKGIYQKNITINNHDPNNPTTILQVFPNPTKGNEIYINCDKNIESISIINGLGQKIYFKKINNDKIKLDFNLDHGIYFFHFSLSNGIQSVEKIIVEK